MPHIGCYPGLHDVLDFCRRSGVRLAMNTNRTDGMDMLLHNCRLEGYFDPIVLCERRFPPETGPRRRAAHSHQWNVNPGQTLFIGDSASDKGAADGASIPFLSFQTGRTRPPQRLRFQHAAQRHESVQTVTSPRFTTERL